MILPGPVSRDSQLFGSLVHLIDRFEGFMFIANSIMLPDCSFLVGPMAEQGKPTQDAVEPQDREIDPNEWRHIGSSERVDSARVAMREAHYCSLAARGFRCARWLPLFRREDTEDQLRPVDDIAGRQLALNALYRWVSAPEDNAAAERLRGFVDRNTLHEHLTAEENQILSLPRPEANHQHADTIGWRLENMWALAWILGFEPVPPFYQGQLPSDITRRTVLEFLPDLGASVSSFLEKLNPRPATEVAQQEDLYYCPHNAVRSAQMGEDTVPRHSHPVRDGGAIHERRHALTWALSPGTTWDDTDSST